jgi:hypothetical protein
MSESAATVLSVKAQGSLTVVKDYRNNHLRIKMMIWVLKHPRATLDMLGYIPNFLSDQDPRKASEQMSTNYQGGWHPMVKFGFPNQWLRYPGDPPMPLIAEAQLRNETLRFYDCSWLAIIQPDGSYEVSRVD